MEKITDRFLEGRGIFKLVCAHSVPERKGNILILADAEKSHFTEIMGTEHSENL